MYITSPDPKEKGKKSNNNKSYFNSRGGLVLYLILKIAIPKIFYFVYVVRKRRWPFSKFDLDYPYLNLFDRAMVSRTPVKFLYPSFVILVLAKTKKRGEVDPVGPGLPVAHVNILIIRVMRLLVSNQTLTLA